MLLLAWVAGSAAQPNVTPADSAAAASSHPQSKFFDSEDGWFDVSAFLDTGHGFVPIVVPITEPAVGYGLGGGLVFIERNESSAEGEYRRPNMSVVGGMGTENGTWATFAGDSRSWQDDRYQTLAAAVYGSIDLDFYGIGDGPLNDHPAHYEIEPLGGMAQLRRRLGNSAVELGVSYAFASFEVSFDDDSTPSQVAPGELDSRIGGLIPTIVVDSRNNLFTPTQGFYGELRSGLFMEAVGSSSNFENIAVTGIYYRPLSAHVYVGTKLQAKFSFDDAPFYTRPYISLRGAPVMRYLGEHAASLELEARWQFWRRISAVGFVGEGIAWIEGDQVESDQTITTGGGGLRYELARRYGLHMGFDVAWSPDDFALYIQFGNAWFRP